MVAKQVDSKGRIFLSKDYAGSTMLVERRPDGSVLLRPAVTVPADEAWLWRNKEALAMVRSGIEEARRGEHAPPPDLRAAAKLARQVEG